MAVGGVTPENAVNFYRLGYKGVAAGSNLVPKHAKRSDLKKIRETARKYVDGVPNMSNQVEDMTWREVQERLREFPVVIVPIGSTEQHGYHLPIGTDVYSGGSIWLKRQQKKRERLCIQVFILGILGVGVTESELVTIRQGYSSGNIERCCSFCRKIRVKILIFMNGHEANRSVIKYAIREIQDETDVKVSGGCFIREWKKFMINIWKLRHGGLNVYGV